MRKLKTKKSIQQAIDINRIAEKTHFQSATVKTIVQQVLDQTTVELAQNNRLELRNFGVFEPWTRKARNAQNPRTMECISVPVKRTVRFKMGQQMRDAMHAVTQRKPSDRGCHS